MQVREVQNYGGFFGGDTVTLVAVDRETGLEQTLTIDEAALVGVRGRHAIVAGMLLAVELEGAIVQRAELLGAASHSALREALGPAQPLGPLSGPLVLAYRCESCGLWLAGSPDGGRCRVCGTQLGGG
jgi:hypothetical protein